MKRNRFEPFRFSHTVSCTDCGKKIKKGVAEVYPKSYRAFFCRGAEKLSSQRDFILETEKAIDRLKDAILLDLDRREQYLYEKLSTRQTVPVRRTPLRKTKKRK